VNDFQQYPKTNKVLVLGDMFELGIYSQEEHEKIIALIENYPYNAILLIGKHYGQCRRRSHFHYFENS